MKTKILGGVAIMTMGFCLIGVGCKKPKPTAKLDPHSPEAVNLVIQQQQALLSEAFKTNDLLFIHNQMYYIGTLGKALSQKLGGEKKERVDAILERFNQVVEEIDNSAGRKHRDATEANLQRFYAVSKELDAEFKPQVDRAKKK